MALTDEASALIQEADQAGYQRGIAAAGVIALNKKTAAVVLRAVSNSLTALASNFATPVPLAANAFTKAANELKSAATALGG